MEQSRVYPAVDIKQEISCPGQTTASTSSDSGISQSYDMTPDHSGTIHGYASVSNHSLNTHCQDSVLNLSVNSRSYARVSNHSVNAQDQDIASDLSVSDHQSSDQVAVNTAGLERSSEEPPAISSESSESSNEDSSSQSEDIDVDGQDTDDTYQPVASIVQRVAPPRYEDSGVILNRTVSPADQYMSLYGGTVQRGLNYHRRLSDLRGPEDSGVSLNRTVSPVDLHSFASPQRDFNNPLSASTPVWRPWSGQDEPRNHFIGNVSHIRPAHMNPPMSSFHHMQPPHDYFPSPDRYIQQYPFNPFNHSYNFLPLLSSIQLPFRPPYNYHRYPMMPLLAGEYTSSPRISLPSTAYGTSLMPFFDSGFNTSQIISVPPSDFNDFKLSQPARATQSVPVPVHAAGSIGSSLSPPYQVPQVTSSYATRLDIKRPSSAMCDYIPDKQPRYTSTPENNTDRLPLVEISPVTNEQSQTIHGVMLSLPPADALPVRVSQRGKRKAATENKPSAKATDNAKKRDRPPPYGDREMHEVFVKFDNSLLKDTYCDINGNYRVPNVPDCPIKKEQLRKELLELFQHSNLPKVPAALMDNVDALVHFPHMQHLLSLYVDGVDLDTLQFGAYGQAFANPKLISMSEEELNSLLDKMSYLGADGMMHCLVKRAVNNGAVCDHVAKELGKMRRHAKNHYPQKKWVCCFCRAQMPDMTDMERHTSTHTVLKPFKCFECNKLFAQKVTLSHHMRNVHNKELETVDPKMTLTCRQHGILFREHERKACLAHLEQHHRKSEDFKNRKKRRQFPYDL